MRIAAARVVPVRLRFACGMTTARGAFLECERVLLELTGADGAAGWGEAAPWPGFGTETAASALARLEAAAGLLASVDITLARWPAALEERLRGAPAARAAVQGALLDLEARRAGRPLAAWLAEHGETAAAGPWLRRVATSALLRAATAEQVLVEAQRARAAGHRAAKLKLGACPLRQDLERAAAAREGLGSALALRGDANGAWSEVEARAALEALAAFGFEYVEQPVPAARLDLLAALRRAGPLRIAADESAAGEAEARAVLAAGAADVLVLKPAMLGGADRALQVAADARAAGVQVVFTHAFESAVGAHHALHCAAAWGDAAAVHGLDTTGLFESDVAAPVGSTGGHASVPDGPGLGVRP